MLKVNGGWVVIKPPHRWEAGAKEAVTLAWGVAAGNFDPCSQQGAMAAVTRRGQEWSTKDLRRPGAISRFPVAVCMREYLCFIYYTDFLYKLQLIGSLMEECASLAWCCAQFSSCA